MKSCLPKNSIYENSDPVGRGAPRPDDGSDPRIVIRGESSIYTPTICHKSLANHKSFIDYLSFSYRPNYYITDFDVIPMRDVLVRIFNIPEQDWSISQAGWNGYKCKASLGVYGLVAWGGASQNGTIHVQLPGQGCAMVDDWIAAYEWGISNEIKLTRIDVAHDDFGGETVNIRKGREWVDKGLFSLNGRPPNVRYIDDYDSGKGKTLYIGERKNGKLIRIYEKGKEQGQPDSSWCRAEVEYRSKSRRIDWDVVLNPDLYLAGSCEAFSYLSSEQSRLETIKNSKRITLSKAIKYCRIGYGQLINLLYEQNDQNAEAVISMLIRNGYPAKLKAFHPIEQKIRRRK